jgi:hypothetical protein
VDESGDTSSTCAPANGAPSCVTETVQGKSGGKSVGREELEQPGNNSNVHAAKYRYLFILQILSLKVDVWLLELQP